MGRISSRPPKGCVKDLRVFVPSLRKTSSLLSVVILPNGCHFVGNAFVEHSDCVYIGRRNCLTENDLRWNVLTRHAVHIYSNDGKYHSFSATHISKYVRQHTALCDSHFVRKWPKCDID